MANKLFNEALHLRALDAFQYDIIEKEVSFGRSRLDFRLVNSETICWVEVKLVTFVEDSVGKFPDAPTSRGHKHLGEMAKLAGLGERASVVFIAQRADAVRFASFTAIDPVFADTLQRVCHEGVEVHAYRCDVSVEQIVIAEEIPVNIDNNL